MSLVICVSIVLNEFISRNGDIRAEADTVVSDKIKDIVPHLSLY